MGDENMTPENQNHVGSVGTESEPKVEDRLLTWAQKIKKGFREKTAQGFVIARTDFTITEAEGDKPQSIIREKEGWDQIMFRGSDDTNARPNVAVVESAMRVFKLKQPPEEKELRVVSVEVDALSQKIERVGDTIDRNTLASVSRSMKDRRILMFSYQQPNPEEIARGDATKTVCLFVDKIDADEILDLVDLGVDPNLVWGALRFAFTDNHTRNYWDDTLVYSSGETPTDSPRERRNVLNSYDKRVFETTADATPVSDVDQDNAKKGQSTTGATQPVPGLEPENVEPRSAPLVGASELGSNPEDESNTEFDFSDWSFADLDQNIRHLETTGDELTAAMLERDTRASSDVNSTALGTLRAEVRDILLRKGNTSESRREIGELASKIENERFGADPNYKPSHQKINGGIVRAAGTGVVNWLNYLNARDSTDDNVEALEIQSNRTHFLKGVIEEDEIGSGVQKAEARASGSEVAEVLGGIFDSTYKAELDHIPTLEGQREWARHKLEIIETTENLGPGFSLPQTFTKLENSVSLLRSEVAMEVRMRLGLWDAAALVRAANGVIKHTQETGPVSITIGEAVTLAKGRRHEQEGVHVAYFLKPGGNFHGHPLPGLEGHAVGEAWDQIQNANFKYSEIIRKINAQRRDRGESELIEGGTVRFDDDPQLRRAQTNYFTDRDTVRRDAVTEYLTGLVFQKIIVNRLKENGIASPDERQIMDAIAALDSNEAQRLYKNAQVSMRLAESASMAWFENPVFNQQALSGNDQVAKIFNLEAFRRTRVPLGRTRGEDATIPFIPGFGMDWLKQDASGIRDEYLGHEGPNPRIIPGKTHRVPYQPILKRAVETPLYVADIDPDKIERDAWVEYATSTLVKLDSLVEIVINPNPDIRLSAEDFRKLVDFINRADPAYTRRTHAERFGIDVDDIVGQELLRYRVESDKRDRALNLRFYVVLGIVSAALTQAYEDPLRVSWTRTQFESLGRSLKEIELSGTAGTFISIEQWEKILQGVDFETRMAEIEAVRNNQAR